jgi:hypothetical protein
MSIHVTGGDFAENLLERRWFASMAAARAKQAECEALLEVVAIARASWRDSRAELSNLEALRDALGEQMSELVNERDTLRELFTQDGFAEEDDTMNPPKGLSAA